MTQQTPEATTDNVVGPTWEDFYATFGDRSPAVLAVQASMNGGDYGVPTEVVFEVMDM
ncbi:hypothetical protein KDA23_06420 [Candidatus Saccharibacteria bacterium]|nr:hypothetical protein [Candidatus Saccharibacteria bacterium]